MRTHIHTIQIPSTSTAGVTYDVDVYDDGTRSCTCPAWRFQRRATPARSCKHTRAAAAGAGQPKADSAQLQLV